jgi:hypothetical protein
MLGDDIYNFQLFSGPISRNPPNDNRFTDFMDQVILGPKDSWSFLFNSET